MKDCFLQAKRASPPQELEFTGPKGPEILVAQNWFPTDITHEMQFIMKPLVAGFSQKPPADTDAIQAPIVSENTR